MNQFNTQKTVLGFAVFFLILSLGWNTSAVADEPLLVDTNGDWVISHEEMLRVVEMWKAGAYLPRRLGAVCAGSSGRK